MEIILILIPFALIPWIFCILKKEPINYYYYSILIYWFPIHLPFDITVSEFFLYFAIISFFIDKKDGTDMSQSMPNYVLLFFILFTLGGITSISNSISNEFLLTGFRRTVIFPIAIIFLTFKLIHNELGVEKVIRFFTISSLIFLCFLYFYPRSSSWMNYRGIEALRLGGEYFILNKYKFAFYESTLGALFGFLLPTYLSEYITNRRKKYFYFLVFIVMIISLVLTMGRAGWIAGFIGILLVNLSNTILSIKKAVYGTVLGVVIVVFFKYFFLIVFPFTWFALDRLFTLYDFQSVGTYKARLFQWTWAYEVFKENMFGIGFWNFAKISFSKGKNYSGNSSWLMLILDVGIIGSIGFLLFYINILIRGIFQLKIYLKERRIRYVGMLTSIAVLPIAGMGETFFQSNYYASFSVWLIFALTASMLRIKQSNHFNS